MTYVFPRVIFAALESYSLVGGLQQFNRRVVAALSDLADRAGATPPVIVLRGDGPEHVADRAERAIFHACGPSRLKFLARTLASVRNADVLLLGHVNLLPVALMARLLKPTLKVVLFVHGEDVWNDPAYRSIRPWEPLLIGLVSRIGAVSAFTAGRMASAFRVPITKFTVFPNAVDPLAVAPVRGLHKPIMLTVARLAAHDHGKHHDSVLKALPLVLQHISDVRYRVVGDGVIRVELEALAEKLGVRSSVDFTGRLSDNDLAQTYAEAAVFVMPSAKEGFGIVFLEAWLRGIPVICGTEDASHEVVSDSVDGYAVHHDDIAGLADRIVELLSDPARSAVMGGAGRQKVLAHYLMANFTANLDALLAEIRK